MEVNTYIELIDKRKLDLNLKENIKIDLYITLLSLNNSNYNTILYQEEINLIEDFLRKINNLKVKIQLKRKPEEITNLLNNIKEIYLKNITLIDKYNKEFINIINVLESKNAKDLTNLLDKLTKEKIKKISNNEYYNQIRKYLIDNKYKADYTINKDNITINNNIISKNEFYDIFSYLLDIKNYKEPYENNETIELHTQLIKDIIDIINEKRKLDKEIIPMTLTYLLTKQIQNYELINAENFNIENIKITDLYSFASSNQINNHPAKWQKIKIPNKYLYKKIKESIFHGMYYFKDNNFIIDINDFKTSIEINKAKEFIKENLKKIKDKSV